MQEESPHPSHLSDSTIKELVSEVKASRKLVVSQMEIITGLMVVALASLASGGKPLGKRGGKTEEVDQESVYKEEVDGEDNEDEGG